MMVVIVPSGEFFFTKTNKKKNVDLASHPRTNIKQYIQVSGCYRRGGVGGRGVIPYSPALLACTTCVTTREAPLSRAFISQDRRTVLFLSASQLLSASRGGHGMEAGQQWER